MAHYRSQCKVQNLQIGFTQRCVICLWHPPPSVSSYTGFLRCSDGPALSPLRALLHSLFLTPGICPAPTQLAASLTHQKRASALHLSEPLLTVVIRSPCIRLGREYGIDYKAWVLYRLYYRSGSFISYMCASEWAYLSFCATVSSSAKWV